MPLHPWPSRQDPYSPPAPDLPIRIAAQWFIRPTNDVHVNSRQVERAIASSRQCNSITSADLRMMGIKLICDDIVNACTAYLSQPYDYVGLPLSIWLPEYLKAMFKEADSGNLQMALHAIGDSAITIAIDSLEKHARGKRRHRIEHLELVSSADAHTLDALGLTASIQLDHANPAVIAEQPRSLGAERC